MTALKFDTLTYSKRLKAVGVSEEQAEVQAETLRDFKEDLINLASKEDLHQLKTELKEDLQSVKTELLTKMATKEELAKIQMATKEELAKIQISLIKWMITLSSGWGVLIVSAMAVFKFLH